MTAVWLLFWMFNGFPDIPITMGRGNHWIIGLAVCVFIDLLIVFTRGQILHWWDT